MKAHLRKIRNTLSWMKPGHFSDLVIIARWKYLHRERVNLIKQRSTKSSPFSSIVAKYCFVIFFATVTPFYCEALVGDPHHECDWSNADVDGESIASTFSCQSTSLGHALNVSLPYAGNLVSLSVSCVNPAQVSNVSNGTFLNFQYIQTLRIEFCPIAQLPDFVFIGLVSIKNLTLYLNNTKGKPLILNKNSFAEVPAMEVLEIGYNGIVSIPVHSFCHLKNLKVLNLTHNELDDSRSLGLEPKIDTVCLPELDILDLSYNILKSIPDEAFASLRTLKVLYLNNNQLSELYPYAFSGLAKLSSLDLSNNRISHLPEQIFQQSYDLLELYLQNNSLNSLTPSVFHGLRQLVSLNLSYNTLDNIVASETLADLSRLVVLDLNHNHFQVINTTFFYSVSSLQILYLSYNKICNVSDNSFSFMRNLHTLTLAGNKLRFIDENTFSGLSSLNYISLNNNEIEDIHPNGLKACSSAQNWKMRSNRLIAFPIALNNLFRLKHLDLTHNKIQRISNSTFDGLKSVVSLHLSRNHIGNMSKGCFKDLNSLKTLDMSHNRVQSLEHGLFDDVFELRVIRFNDNELSDINGLFINLRHLHTLNVSRNKITWFDYALVPAELKILDVHDNDIDSLGNYFKLESMMQLRTLDASYNGIRELTSSSLPHSLEAASFRNNQITVIGPFAFMAKVNLTFVDLRGNALRYLDINAFRLENVPTGRDLPIFFLANNTLFCDCTMEWLHWVNNMDETRQYPRIEDLPDVMCDVTFPRQKATLSLSKLRSGDFLCKYHSQCFALCNCCDFDACDCEMLCPENCTCYSDQTWNTNMVDCSLRGHSYIPYRIPMDVTDLYLDGNDMSNVGSHSFIGRKNMRVLHLNNSNIHVIRNRTFNGLQNLLVLHLENNHISVIQGHEFTNLTNLQELYLSRNRLNSIRNTSFSHLKYLKVLYLDHNHLSQFQVWNLNFNRQLVRVKLGHNKWSCDCSFVEYFLVWFVSHRSIIIDGGRIRCSFNNSTTHYLVEFGNSTCSNFSMGVPFTSAAFVEEYMPAMIVVPMVLLFVFFLLFLIWRHKNRIKMSIYSKYGVRLFEKSSYSSDTDKLFDAFLSYCKKDEAFVAQMLAPELECGDPPHRLCLRHRDLSVSSYVAEAVSEAIESSRCTVAVVSEQYLKSEGCRYELKAAHNESQCNKRHKVVVVIVEKMNFKELDSDIRLCFRHAALIVHWGDRRFWEKLRFVMPDSRSREKHHVNSTDTKLTTSLRRSSLSNSSKLV